MQYLEDKYQRLFLEKTSPIEKLIESSSPVILDTSAFVGFLPELRNRGHETIYEYQIATEYDIGFFSWLEQNLNDKILFPSEALCELKFANTIIGSYVRESVKRTKKRVRGKKANGGERFLMSKHRKLDVRERFKLINKAVANRKNFLKNVINNYPLEIHIPGWLGTDLDEDYSIHNLYTAVKDIAARPGVIMDYSGRHGDSGPSEENKGNDQRIFTKCLGIAYEWPATLLTADSDFFRMQKHFYGDRDNLEEKFDFAAPQNEVKVAFMHKGNLWFYEKGDVQKVLYSN